MKKTKNKRKPHISPGINKGVLRFPPYLRKHLIRENGKWVLSAKGQDIKRLFTE